MPELKQVIVVRKDLKMPKGKMSAQAAHASVESVLRSSEEIVSEWISQGMKKIVVYVEDEKELLDVQQAAKRECIVASVITDAGKTVVSPGTKTCLAIGPDIDEKIDKVSGKLKLVN
jgi:peptidyl-tRNA hydrolase, PTH2 family